MWKIDTQLRIEADRLMKYYSTYTDADQTETTQKDFVKSSNGVATIEMSLPNLNRKSKEQPINCALNSKKGTVKSILHAKKPCT